MGKLKYQVLPKHINKRDDESDCPLNPYSSDIVVTSKKSKLSQPPFTYSKVTIETLEQGVNYVQS